MLHTEENLDAYHYQYHPSNATLILFKSIGDRTKRDELTHICAHLCTVKIPEKGTFTDILTSNQTQEDLEEICDNICARTKILRSSFRRSSLLGYPSVILRARPLCSSYFVVYVSGANKTSASRKNA